MRTYKSDTDFMEQFEQFAFREIVSENGQQPDDETQYMAILSALIGCQGIDAYQAILPKALDGGLSPAAAREIVYQSVDFLGMGRIWPFLSATNVILEARGEHLPLPDLSAEEESRFLEKHTPEPSNMFGDQMKEVWKDSHINKWLDANSFNGGAGAGLTPAQREMTAFCFLMAQGGCEPQLMAQIKSNISIGNDREFLMRVISQCLPYIGYPRSINAVSCVKEVQ